MTARQEGFELPRHVVCDHCLSCVAGTFYDFYFEGSTYYYCSLACMSYGVRLRNVDYFDLYFTLLQNGYNLDSEIGRLALSKSYRKERE
jgi:hypothetical protein